MLRDNGINVRDVTVGDREAWVQMRLALWPDTSTRRMRRHSTESVGSTGLITISIKPDTAQ